MPRPYKIITLGCKINQYESAYLAEALQAAGCHPAAPGEPAALTIINTCAVTQRAVHQSRQAIRKAVRENPLAMVAATGCYAQLEPTSLAKIPGLDLIAGNTMKGRLPQILLDGPHTGGAAIKVEDLAGGSGMLLFEHLPVKCFQERSRAFLKIQDGCRAFCSYCVVPLARGPYRSLPVTAALSALEDLAAAGYREVVLTGIHLGKYGTDLPHKSNLVDLLKAFDRLRLPLRLRLSSIEPTEIGDELLDLAASREWFCRHFHIPLQSGDPQILARMNRHYTPQAFAALLERIHRRLPAAAIGVDVMCGFPGETGAAHRRTRELLQDLPASYFHVFPFSARPGTKAYDMRERIEPDVIKQRCADLRHLGSQKQQEFSMKFIGETFEVLDEGWHCRSSGLSRGTSDNYLTVIFPGVDKNSGGLLKVQITELFDHGLEGRIKQS